MHYVKYNDFFMLKLYLLFFGFTNVFFFAQITAKVVGIKDGDTIVILEDGNKTKTLRLAEVDCPESGQPFGKNAKDFTSSQVFGKIISFVETDQDRYGRTIAKVYYDNGKYLSKEIIKKVQQVRSHEVEILQLADLLVGATAYVNRGLANSKAKNELINLIKHRSKYSLTKSTLLKERKFNVFIWEPQKPYFV